MAQTIQIKRNNSNAATKPSSLLVGELAGNLLDRSLYSYDGSNVFQFYTGTDKWFDLLGNANNAIKLGGVSASDYLSKTDASKTYQTILGLDNKLSASYISGLAIVATSGKYSDLSGTPSSLPASDVYDWAKAATKPTYTASEVGALSTGGGTLTGGLTISSGNLLVSKTAGDVIVNQLYPTADNAYLLGHSGRRWSDLYTVLINGGTPINSNNYSSYALPLSGGTLTNSLAVSAGTISSTRTSTRRAVFYKNASTSMDAGTYIVDVSDSGDAALKLTYDSLTWKGNTVIHSGNYSSYALPLSGGTINGNLSINRGGYPYISYSNSSTFYGYLGFSDVGIPSMYDGSAWRDIIHSGNYSSYALPLSGGTLTASKREVLYLNTTAAYCDLTLQINKVDKAVLSYDATHGVYVYSYPSGRYIGVKDDGTPYYNNGSYNTLIHSGNIGSHNAGSATKLQTARSIWGQSFDGTGNITGNITLTNADQINGNWGIALNVNCGGLVDTSIWNGKEVENVRFKANGNVLIGTTTDSGAKLQVNGGISVSGALYDTSNNEFIYSSGNLVRLGTGTAAKGYNTYIDGNNIYLRYGTTYKDGITLASSGNVLIGTTSDNGAKLQVEGNVTANVLTVNSGADGNAGSGLSLFYDNGFVNKYGIHMSNTSVFGGGGDVTGSWATYFSMTDVRNGGWIFRGLYGNVVAISYTSGNLTVTGDGVFGSDARYKSKLQDLSVDLATIANAPVFSYKWTDREDNKVHLGTTAQYWMETNFKDAVDVSNKDFYHLNYGALGVAIGVSLAKKTFDHEERIKALEKENKELKNEIKQLKQWHN